MRKIMMPETGKSPGLVTVRRWFRAAGDSVTKGDLLAQVESGEGLVELEAASGGVVAAILVPAGKTVASGTVIAEIEEMEGIKQKIESRKQKEEAVMPAEIIPVIMPQAGNSMEEGTIVKWLVKEGDRVKKGQVIFEIETDKANMEVEATEDGRIAKIVAGEGATVPVKQPVAFMGEGEVGEIEKAESRKQNEDVSDEATERRSDEGIHAVPASPAVVDEAGRIKASPAARRMAMEQGVDLASVSAGSGPGGRILSSDLASARSSGASRVAPPAVAVPAPKPVAPPAVVATGNVVRKKMSKMRKAIAANLSASKQTIPHFYLRETIAADAMMAFYKGEKAKYPCSVNDVVVLGLAKAMMEFPAFRSKIDGDEVVEYPNANVGIAVGVEDGLTVPVLLGAQKMTLQQIAANSKRIAENARSGKLEGWGEGNFTITNLGMFGVEEFAAIVNPPEPGIMAVGAVREGVIVKDGFMKPGKLMTMTLSCDHRIIDGLLAAKFMARLKELLESPTLLG